MKTITVKQPWGSLIVEGIKDIENRTWRLPEKYKGQRVLIHTSQKPIRFDGLGDILTSEQFDSLNGNIQPFIGNNCGSIIGSVVIVDCVKNHPSIWAEKENWNWILDNPIKFENPIMNVKGKLSFWDYDIKGKLVIVGGNRSQISKLIEAAGDNTEIIEGTRTGIKSEETKSTYVLRSCPTIIDPVIFESSVKGHQMPYKYHK